MHQLTGMSVENFNTPGGSHKCGNPPSDSGGPERTAN